MEATIARKSTGVAGLDEVLQGGLVPGGTYLVRGGPGTGKTTLGLHFLAAGAAQGESSLFISLSEPEVRVRRNAESMGFDLTGIAFLDLTPAPEFFTAVEAYDIFSPAEVEREPTTRRIVEQVEQLKPERVFLDAMTQFRYLASDAFQFRKQALSFMRFMSSLGATVLMSSEGTQETPDADLQFLSDGVIELGVEMSNRSVTVIKMRGSGYREGPHAVRLTGQGMHVFPRLLPAEYAREFVVSPISSGVPELDEMLHGGLERGTVTILSGPTGSGKTTVGTLFMKEAAGRGERSVLYAFEESLDTLVTRCEAINIPVRSMMERGTLSLVRVEPLQFTADEFSRSVRREVEERSARIVMLDSLAGFKLTLKPEDLVRQVHALCKYLSNMGVTTLLINEVEAITGDFRATELGISYLADNIVFMRYLELNGELRKAIGVLKKRLTNFEKTMREIEVSRYGVKVGRPLVDLTGILTGTPVWAQPKGGPAGQ